MLDIRQKFEGVIYNITETEIEARLIDLTNINSPNELVIITKEKFSDIHSYQVGSMFNLEIGYETLEGTRRRYSKITKKDWGVWTQEDLDKAKQRSSIYDEFFKRKTSYE